MLQRLLIILTFFFSTTCAEAQGLQSFDYYIAHPGISQEAKDYYYGRFNINTSEQTSTILDSVFTRNEDTRPFYIYLVGKMLPEAESSLLKEINIVCRYVAEQHPADLVGVLFADEGMVPARYKNLWADRVAVELRVTCDYELMDCFKNSRITALNHYTGTGKNKLEILYNLIRRDMNLFQQH